MAQVMEEPKVRGLDRLRALRDELRVQAALAKAETRERWEWLELRWNELEGRVERLAEASGEALEDVQEAAQGLIEEIGDGYERISGAARRETPPIPGLDRIARMRDELRLKLALGKAEAKAEWERMERRWDELRSKARDLEGASVATASELRRAAGELIDEIGAGYERIKKAL